MIRSARSVSKPLACSDGPVRPNRMRHAATLAAAGASASAAIEAKILFGSIRSGSQPRAASARASLAFGLDEERGQPRTSFDASLTSSHLISFYLDVLREPRRRLEPALAAPHAVPGRRPGRADARSRLRFQNRLGRPDPGVRAGPRLSAGPVGWSPEMPPLHLSSGRRTL